MRAVRIEANDSLDLFCTAPWGTRALCEHVILPHDFAGKTAWDPCAGLGHMSGVLGEYFVSVFASDVHDYGLGHEIGSFVGEGPDVVPSRDVDWICFNPPFRLSLEFVERGLAIAKRGVAALVRTAWLEGAERYRRLFCLHPPSKIAIFSERLPLLKGRWDPNASSATSYSWIVWRKGPPLPFAPQFVWVPPGAKNALTRSDDAEKYAIGVVFDGTALTKVDDVERFT